MIHLNIHEAKTHLSKYLDRVTKGESIVLCRRNRPIAEIRPLPPRRTRKRRLGLYAGKITIPKEFYDPLPEEFVAYFDESPR